MGIEMQKQGSAGSDFHSDRTLGRAKEALESRGYFDGYSGTNEGVPPDLSEAFASRRVERSKSFKRGELGEQQAILRRSEEERQLVSDSFQQSLKAQDRMEAERREHPSRYAWILGCVFVGLSLILLLADIPLSIKIVAQDLNLKVHSLNANLLNFSSKILEESWSALAISLGIALFPIVMKIPYEHFTQKETKDGGVWLRGKRLVSAILVAVLALSLGSLLLLAKFRSDATRTERGRDDAQAALFGDNSAQQINAGAGTNWVEDWAFIFVTLTLPIAATIFFAEGTKRVQNRLLLSRETDIVQKHRNEHLECVRKEAFDREKVKKLQQELIDEMAWSAKRDIARHEAIAFYSDMYQQGKEKWEQESQERSLFSTTLVRDARAVRPIPQSDRIRKEECVQ